MNKDPITQRSEGTIEWRHPLNGQPVTGGWQHPLTPKPQPGEPYQPVASVQLDTQKPQIIRPTSIVPAAKPTQQIVQVATPPPVATIFGNPMSDFMPGNAAYVQPLPTAVIPINTLNRAVPQVQNLSSTPGAAGNFPQISTTHQPAVAASTAMPDLNVRPVTNQITQPLPASQIARNQKPPDLAAGASLSAPGIVTPLPTAPTSVSIQINLPKVGLPKVLTAASVKHHASKVKLSKNQLMLLQRAGTVIAVIGLLSVSGLQVHAWQEKRSAEAAAAAVTAKAAGRTKPTFKPLAPADSANRGANGTPQISYDSTRNTYSFTDTVKGMPVVVSMQPTPGTFKDATVAVEKIAGTMGAKQSVQTNVGNAYLTTDPKSNSQTVVFTKNQLVVFVQSPYTHTSAEWQVYIEALKTATN